MSKINKALDYIEEVLVCLCLIAMTALTFGNAVLRKLGSGISFSEEISTYLFVLLSLLGSAIAAKRGAHLGLTLVTERVGAKAARILGIISMIFSTAFSALICYYGVFMAINQYEKGQVTLATQLPECIFGSFVPIGALFPTWGYKFSPLTFKWFTQVFTKYKGLKAFKDSFVLSLISAPITALLSMIISYLVVKKKFKAKGFIEAVSMLAMAVPGTVLGVGYIRGFSGGLFHTGLLSGLYGSAAILIIVFVVRSLPTGTRSGISAQRQIDKSIEESAYDMGANSFRVFMTVTLPLIKDSFLSGLVTAFVRSITAISAIILLVTPQFLLITVQINEFAEKGSYSIACAFATILILITYGSVLLMNLAMKFFGTSKKIKEA